MATTNGSVATRDVRRTVSRVVVGVIGGIVAYYATAVVATAPIVGNFTVHPLLLALLAVVAALALLIGWRWPTVGVTAGIVVFAIIVFALAQRLSWSDGTAQWLDPADTVGFGGASGCPAMVAAVLVTVSVLRLREGRTR